MSDVQVRREQHPSGAIGSPPDAQVLQSKPISTEKSYIRQQDKAMTTARTAEWLSDQKRDGAWLRGQQTAGGVAGRPYRHSSECIARMDEILQVLESRGHAEAVENAP